MKVRAAVLERSRDLTAQPVLVAGKPTSPTSLTGKVRQPAAWW